MDRGWLGAAAVIWAGAARPSAISGCPACDPLCVEPGRYAVTEELAVDRSQGGLVWQRRATERLPHAEAARYCKDLTMEGRRGFRLPTHAELVAIRYKPGGLFGGGRSRHSCVPCVDQAAFPETPAAEFWTADQGEDGTAWYVDFGDGRSHRDVLGDALWVRCVQDGW